MDNLISNKIMDKGLPNERKDYLAPVKEKKLEKDIKRIFFLEKIIDYRCYFHSQEQIICYTVETNDKYLLFKENLITKQTRALEILKEELK